ncbi:hypothetical protein KC19_VG027600 [Ceratodon purpureus]|uniref:Secreted protein n=1 Tax=Ceratodon purpureus TaxID=3225 RepID=A0A8T0HLD3_CERPU|nr:hypothetical protein KC19_VG027600 [Ceratodon purpureus]
MRHIVTLGLWMLRYNILPAAMSINRKVVEHMWNTTNTSNSVVITTMNNSFSMWHIVFLGVRTSR